VPPAFLPVSNGGAGIPVGRADSGLKPTAQNTAQAFLPVNQSLLNKNLMRPHLKVRPYKNSLRATDILVGE
jgi:hypothetical protein